MVYDWAAFYAVLAIWHDAAAFIFGTDYHLGRFRGYLVAKPAGYRQTALGQFEASADRLKLEKR